MSSHSKLWLVVGLVCATTFAGRVSFTEGTKASLDTSLTSTDRGPSAVSINLHVPYVDLSTQRDGFTAVDVTGLNVLERLGSPAVMTKGQLIAVPNGYRPVLTVNASEAKVLPGTVIKPHQAKFRCECSQDSFSFNKEQYESSSIYPSTVAKLEKVGNFHGVNLYRVALNPIQVDFARKSTLITTDISAKVQFVQVTDAPKAEVPASIARVLGQEVVNANDSAVFSVDNRADKMLIITADSLKAAITPYVDWKSQSMDVSVATYTEAGGSKEAVQKFIQAAYTKEKFTFLLMVGNKTTNPGYMESTGSGSAATDYKFALLDGSDNIPDVFYGRLLADDAAEAKTQVARWVAYEKAPEQSDWYTNASTIASNEGSSPSDKEYAIQVGTALKGGSYKQVDGFFQGDHNATSANIKTALNRGSSWLAYFGHGSGTSWGSTNDTFSNATVATLTNTRLPIIIDVACLNASWVNLAKPFGKAWVTQETNGKAAGAVAFYGGSVSISWDPPAVMSVGIAKSYVEKKLKTIGEATLAGQLHLQAEMGTGSNTQDNLKWYNLFGDPALHIRSEIP